ncbi:hypothetical protein T12_9205 [Trichinella patagoniensis]|uniref:Uncharacterized protein n=1 Tax=Trichinella patagoniensis TaxID=990121 RepID=A0A0V0Z8Y2_9BILA|nr:hypothetical protein T12_9205 [Trichinella patagoniensis]
MNELNRHFPRLRTLGKNMNSSLNGFHAILPTLKKKLSSSTLSCRCTLRSRNQTQNSEKIHAEGIYLPQNLGTVHRAKKSCPSTDLIAEQNVPQETKPGGTYISICQISTGFPWL